jgi:hypothetical protein
MNSTQSGEAAAKIYESSYELQVWNVEYGENITSEWLLAPTFRAALDKAERRIESWIEESRTERVCELLTSKQLQEAGDKDLDYTGMVAMAGQARMDRDDKETRELYAVSKITLAGVTDA